MNKLKYIILLIIIFSNIKCTVKYSFTGASIAPEIKTVSVQYFPINTALAPQTLGQDITDALKDKFMNQTRLIVLNKNGDVNFEGEIVSFDIKPTAITAEEQAAQNRLTISVKVKFTNSIEPEKDFEKTFSRYDDFASNRNLDDVINDKEFMKGIINQIIQDIFNEAFVNW
jgi:hypothetical protein